MSVNFYYVYSNELGVGVHTPELLKYEAIEDQWHRLQFQSAWKDIVLTGAGLVTDDILAVSCHVPYDLLCSVTYPDYLRLPFFAQSYTDRKYYCLVPSRYSAKLAERAAELQFSSAALKRFFHAEGINATSLNEAILGCVYRGIELQTIRIANLSNTLALEFFKESMSIIPLEKTVPVRKFKGFYAQAKYFLSVLQKTNPEAAQALIQGAELLPEEVVRRYAACSGLDYCNRVVGTPCSEFFNNYCRDGEVDLKIAILNRGWHCPRDAWR
jgi:hypothetical protein